MRILLVSQHYWPEEFRINDIVEDLHNKGHVVSVLTGQPNYPAGDIYPGYSASSLGRSKHPSGYEIVRVPIIPRKAGRSLQLALNYLSFIVSASIFAPFLLRGRRFDVVVVYALSPIFQSIPAVLLARLKAVPLVIWVQDLWPDSLTGTGRISSGLVLRSVARITGSIYRKAATIIVQSTAFADPIRALTQRPVPIVYHPNSGEPGLQRIDNTSYPDDFTVLFAGNIGAAQSMATIVDAATEVGRQDPSVKFLIAGAGSEASWVRSEIERRDLKNVTMLGRIPSTEMASVYKRASALLVTLRRSEGIDLTVPSKVQSYLAVGRPIIAALDGEGARVVGESGAAIVMPAEDHGALAQAIMRLRSLSPQQRQAMGDAGRAYYMSHFTLEVLNDRLLDILSKAGKAANEDRRPTSTAR